MKFMLSISLAEGGTVTKFTQLFVRVTRLLEDARGEGLNLVHVDGCEVPNVTLTQLGSGSIKVHG